MPRRLRGKDRKREAEGFGGEEQVVERDGESEEEDDGIE